ncbi:hypothetical protein [Flagellimonas meridianipacifica]|nr:hypothetical protein [Allomuricauda pacifica]
MKTEYEQRLIPNGNLVTITYHYREAWQRMMNGHMRPPVVVKMYPASDVQRNRLINLFTEVSSDIIFIIKEYLSIVKQKFQGISFDYELINHVVRLKEDGEGIDHYRAEISWFDD